MLYKATKFTLLFVISKFWVLIYGKGNIIREHILKQDQKGNLSLNEHEKLSAILRSDDYNVIKYCAETYCDMHVLGRRRNFLYH